MAPPKRSRYASPEPSCTHRGLPAALPCRCTSDPATPGRRRIGALVTRRDVSKPAARSGTAPPINPPPTPGSGPTPTLTHDGAPGTSQSGSRVPTEAWMLPPGPRSPSDSKTASGLSASQRASRQRRGVGAPQLYEPGWLTAQLADRHPIRQRGSPPRSAAPPPPHAVPSTALGITTRRRSAERSFPQRYDPAWLRRRYLDEARSSTAIAAEVGSTAQRHGTRKDIGHQGSLGQPRELTDEVLLE